MSTFELPKYDCHNFLRMKVNQERLSATRIEDTCFSIAWDWIYRGYTSKGINLEVASVIESTSLTRKHGKVALAIPETSLLQTCASILPLAENIESKNRDILKGLYPSIHFLITRDINVVSNCEQKHITETLPFAFKKSLSNMRNPYSHEHFTCRLCKTELSNVFFQCVGCEIFLGVEFFICIHCKNARRYETNIVVNLTNSKMASSINHKGLVKDMKRASGYCLCTYGSMCPMCGNCNGEFEFSSKLNSNFRKNRVIFMALMSFKYYRVLL